MLNPLLSILSFALACFLTLEHAASGEWYSALFMLSLGLLAIGMMFKDLTRS